MILVISAKDAVIVNVPAILAYPFCSTVKVKGSVSEIEGGVKKEYKLITIFYPVSMMLFWVKFMEESDELIKENTEDPVMLSKLKVGK